VVRPNGESQGQITVGMGRSWSGQLFPAEHDPGTFFAVEDLSAAPAMKATPCPSTITSNA
jgi:hypothetical protein